MMQARPSRIMFIIALFLAPALYGVLIWLVSLLGAYAARFAQVGAIGLLLIIPAWFTAFAWLGWRAAKRGERGVRPFVFASLGANLVSGAIYPVLIGLAAFTGVYERAVEAASTDIPPLPAFDAALYAGLASFFLGLFFFPIVAAIFGWLTTTLGLHRQG